MRKSICGALAATGAGLSLLMVPVASAAPAPPAGHHYTIDVATGEATDTATGEVLKPVTAQELLAEKVAHGGPADAKVTMSAQTGEASGMSPATVAIRPIPNTACATTSIYFKVWRVVPEGNSGTVVRHVGTVAVVLCGGVHDGACGT